MISAQSHLLPSNGSRWVYIILFPLLFWVSCSSSKSTARPTIIKPNAEVEISEPKEEILMVDTIEWVFASEEDYPPISIETKVAAFGLEKEIKPYYNIAVFLPLRLSSSGVQLDENNQRFANFYAGMRLSASLESPISARVNVYYTNRDLDRAKALLQSLSYDPPDVIVASYDAEIIDLLADFGKARRIPVISPWRSSSNAAKENVFFLQLRPSIEDYYKRIVRDALAHHDLADIRIIQRTDGQDRSKVGLIQSVNEQLSELPIARPLLVADVTLDSIMLAETNVFDTLLAQGVKSFILPHFSSRDETYVYSCLRKMYGEKLGRPFTVYTMPLILTSDRVDVNLLKNLSVRTAEFRFPDPMDDRVLGFKKMYLEETGWLPTEDAYFGFDLMSFILKGLAKHGKYFHYYSIGEDIPLLQMKLNIRPIFGQSDPEWPDYLVNDHLYIIEYMNDHFEIR